jgi:hypothetical protein
LCHWRLWCSLLHIPCRCPPGHGDIYPSLLGSGMLDSLASQGIKYLFVSNSDNLGATLDLQLLQHFASCEAAFMMEVCERTAADKKGGHLARRKVDGGCLLGGWRGRALWKQQLRLRRAVARGLYAWRLSTRGGLVSAMQMRPWLGQGS